jgi:hypothetical protein
MTNIDIALATMLPRLRGKESRKESVLGKAAIRMIEQHLRCYESKRSEEYGEARRAAI